MRNKQIKITEHPDGLGCSIELNCQAHDQASAKVRLLVWGIEHLTEELFKETEAGRSFNQRMMKAQDELAGQLFGVALGPEHVGGLIASLDERMASGECSPEEMVELKKMHDQLVEFSKLPANDEPKAEKPKADEHDEHVTLPEEFKRFLAGRRSDDKDLPN